MYIINDADIPAIVFSHDRGGFVSKLIKLRAGIPTHAMWLIDLDVLVTQGFMSYKTIKIDKYFNNDKCDLWFFKPILTAEQKMKLLKKIEDDLSKPWYKKCYDFLGIIGHLLGIPFLQNPYKYYCIERITETLRHVGFNVKLHLTPKQLYGYCIRNKKIIYLGKIKGGD